MLHCHLILICERPASRFRKAFGFAVNLHRFCHAAFWSIHNRQKNIRSGPEKKGRQLERPTCREERAAIR